MPPCTWLCRFVEHLGVDLSLLGSCCVDVLFKLTWLVLGEDQAARSHRVEQLTAL